MEFLGLVLSGMSRCKVKNLKIPVRFSKKYVFNPPPPPPVWFSSGIAQCFSEKCLNVWAGHENMDVIRAKV